MSDARSAELAENLAEVTARIDRAAGAAGRSTDELTLIGITKTFPADDVVRLLALGVTEVGENRDQEAAPKAAEVARLTSAAQSELAQPAVASSELAQPELARPEVVRPRWHFVGQMQTNKCASVVRYADVVQSVDRPKLARALDAAAGRYRPDALNVLIQVNLSEDDTPATIDRPARRGGVSPKFVPELVGVIAELPHLSLRGVMAVAPLGVDPRPAFDRLAAVAAVVRRENPAATVISAGMSGDLEAAVERGATHLRVGSALLGGRLAFGG